MYKLYIYHNHSEIFENCQGQTCDFLLAREKVGIKINNGFDEKPTAYFLIYRQGTPIYYHVSHTHIRHAHRCTNEHA